MEAEIRGEMQERAVRAAESYQELARVFSSYIKETEAGEEKEKVRQQVKEALCMECTRYGHCWEDKKEECLEAFRKVAEKTEQTGRLEYAGLPEYFRRECPACESLVGEWNRSAYVEWMKKTAFRQMMEGKEALVHQLEETAKCFRQISEEQGQGSGKKDHWEQEWTEWLRKYRIRVRDVTFHETKGKGREWRVKMRCGAHRGVSVRLLERLLSEKLGVPVRESTQWCRILSESEGEKEMVFKEEPGYDVVTGVAHSVKKDQEISGDSFSFFYEEEGEMTMILSDGMGSGASAARESEEVLGLLERMLSAGFGQETAIRLINSVLALRAEQKNFATLDISRINLYSGMCEFIKIGGASTYIKRGSWIESMSAKTLPIGMVQQVDYDSAAKKLYDGDYIMMMSDGVLDCVPEEERKVFLSAVLGEDTEQKPQVMAGRILNASLLLQNYEPEDDMTVLVCEIVMRKTG